MSVISSNQLIAVLGTGSIGTRHLGVLKSIGEEAIAIPIRSERRAALDAEGWRTASSLAEASSLGARGVVIATDTARHVRDVEKALVLGLKVLCEKPLALSVEDALSLTRVRVAAENLRVAQCLRFDVGLNAFKRLIPEAGAIHSIRVECRSYLPDWRPGRDYRKGYQASAAEGGVLRDLIHDVDYAVWLFGVPEKISGVLVNTGRLGIESEEAAESVWSLPGGSVLSISLDYLTRSPVRSIRAAGDRAEIRYDFITRGLTVCEPGAPDEKTNMSGERNDMYTDQTRAFISFVSGDDTMELATIDEAITDLAVCDAWRQSSQTGLAVEVPRG